MQHPVGEACLLSFLITGITTEAARSRDSGSWRLCRDREQ